MQGVGKQLAAILLLRKVRVLLGRTVALGVRDTITVESDPHRHVADDAPWNNRIAEQGHLTAFFRTVTALLYQYRVRRVGKTRKESIKLYIAIFRTL